MDSDDDSDDEVDFPSLNQITFNIGGQSQPVGSDDDDDTLVGSTMGAVNPTADSDDDTLVGSTMADVRPPSNNFSSFHLSAELRALLPDNWDRGEDGLGSVNSARAKNTMFRRPWEFSQKSIRSMTRHQKTEFFSFVESSIGSRQRAGELSLFAESLMFLLKICHDLPYEFLATLFRVDPALAHDVVYRQLLHHYRNNMTIPCILNADGSQNQGEIDKMFQSAYDNTSEFFKAFNFADPLNRGRIGVFFNADTTYLFTENSSDIELQKGLFCAFKAGHLVKLLTITDMMGKVQGLGPASTSSTPASGDKSILSKWMALEAGTGMGDYMRTFLRGNNLYFPILVVDAGFIAVQPNCPRETRDLPGLTQAAQDCGALVLHTCNSGPDTYHISFNNRGELILVPRDEDRPTLDEVAVKLTRWFRKFQELSYGAKKRMFKMIGAKHISNSLVGFLSPTSMRKNNMPPQFEKVPKIIFFAAVICSIYNKIHAGFRQQFYDTPAQEIEAAERMKRRMLAENPLNHNVFDINFESGRRGPWTELTFADFSGPNNPINFPRLTLDEINPTAVQICSGPHAIVRAQSVLTYISQNHVKDNNITGDRAKEILEAFPGFHKVQYLRVNTRPLNWEDGLFGPWQNITFVRSVMPPTHKSTSSPQNFHTCVIAFGDQGSDRLGLIAPFDRILFWFCYRCPAKNALCSMDRHLAALLMGLSFQEHFKSTAKEYRLLNPVGLDSNQCLIALPMGQQSQDIPQHDTRRSQDTRQMESNPLYVYGALPTQQRSTTLGQPSNRVRATQGTRGRSTLRTRGRGRAGGTSGGAPSSSRGAASGVGTRGGPQTPQGHQAGAQSAPSAPSTPSTPAAPSAPSAPSTPSASTPPTAPTAPSAPSAAATAVSLRRGKSFCLTLNHYINTFHFSNDTRFCKCRNSKI